MRALRPLVMAAVVLTGGAAIAAEADRYVAPGDAFSIDMSNVHLFHLGKVSQSGDMVVADFPFLNTIGLALASSRTVEWIRLDKPVDPLSYDAEATALAAGYLEGRYGPGKFEIADRGKFRDPTGRLVYVFAASGILEQMPAQWQGTVLFFDNGVALVSAMVAQPTNYRFAPKNGIQDQPAVDWALTLKPGG